MVQPIHANPSPADTALALIDRLYAAAMEPHHWAATLQALSRFAGGAGADLFIRSPGIDDFVVWSGIPDELMDLYLAHYHANNRRVQTVATLPAGTLLTDFDLYTPEEIKREPYYQELLFAHGYGYFTGTSLIARDSDQAFYGVHYASGVDAYTAENLHRLRLMAPHVQRAAELQARLGEAASRERELREAFEALAIGAVLLDRRGRVAFANTAALAFATSEFGLELGRGVLRANHPGQQRRLGALLASALRDDETLAASGGQLRVHGPDGAALTVFVAPLPRFRGRAESLAAVVLLGDGRFRQTEFARRMLCDGFGLTASEAALALSLAEGTTITDYARASGLTVGSVRTVSKRVMAKLGVHRQAELATLLVMSFGFLGGPRPAEESEPEP